MGLDDYASDDIEDEYDQSTGSSDTSLGDNRVNSGVSTRWVTKIDFGAPYVIVAVDRQGNLFKHRDQLAVLTDSDDWRRLDDHPDKDFEVIFKMNSREGWLRFCNHAIDQNLGDPEQLLEDDPMKLADIDDRLVIPPGSKPDQSRTCAVCGASSDDEDMTEIQLRSHSKLSVCVSHTVEELAQNGYLQ